MTRIAYWYKDHHDLLDAYRSVRSFMTSHTAIGIASIVFLRGKFIALMDIDHLGTEDADYLHTLLRAAGGGPYDLDGHRIWANLDSLYKKTNLLSQKRVEEQYYPGIWVSMDDD